MTKLREEYHWKQLACKSKLEKLASELEMVVFAIEGKIENFDELSKEAAVEGMKIFAQRMEDGYQRRKKEILAKFPTYDFDSRYKINILGQPTGKRMSFDEFVGFDYLHEEVNISDYRERALSYALLEPPYNLRIEIEAKSGSDEYHKIKTKEYTKLYRMFINDFILYSEFKQVDFIIYEWSDDWSNFFDAGKEWWGTYYWTIYNQANNTIIVLGASQTD